MLPAPLTPFALLRTLLITLVLASQCVSAVPARPLNQVMLGRPEGQRAVHWTAKLLAVVGTTTTDPEAERALIAVTTAGVQLRNQLLAPLQPILSGAAMSQQWGLFLSSSNAAYRLRVEARHAHAPWYLVYSANQLDTEGLGKQLDYRRIRGIYNPTVGGRRMSYPSFARWLARGLLRKHVEIDAVRVSMDEMTLATRSTPNNFERVGYVVESARSGGL